MYLSTAYEINTQLQEHETKTSKQGKKGQTEISSTQLTK